MQTNMSLDQLDRVPSSTSKSESVQAEESAEALSNPSGRYFVAFAEEADDDTLDEEVEVRSIGLLLNVAVASPLSLSLLSLILSLSLARFLRFVSPPFFFSLSLFVSASASAFVSAFAFVSASLFFSQALCEDFDSPGGPSRCGSVLLRFADASAASVGASALGRKYLRLTRVGSALTCKSTHKWPCSDGNLVHIHSAARPLLR